MYCSKYMPYRAMEYKQSGSHFPYHHSVIFRTSSMPVGRVNCNNMPKICRTTLCTKKDKRADSSN